MTGKIVRKLLGGKGGSTRRQNSSGIHKGLRIKRRVWNRSTKRYRWKKGTVISKPTPASYGLGTYFEFRLDNGALGDLYSTQEGKEWKRI